MKFLLLLSFAFMLTGCGVYEYYQVYSLTTPYGESMEYTEDSLIISYNLWNENGQLEFTIYNRADSTLYLDFKQSFFLMNGLTYDYFTNSSITIQNHAIRSNTLQYPAYYRNGYYDLYSNTISEGTAEGITYYEKDVLIIPPHSYRKVNRFQLNQNYLSNCDLEKHPRYNEPKSTKYTAENSPLKYLNLLRIKVGENGTPKSYIHAFYLSEIGNIHPQDFRWYDTKTVCGESIEVISMPYAKKNRFYIRYAP